MKKEEEKGLFVYTKASVRVCAVLMLVLGVIGIYLNLGIFFVPDPHSIVKFIASIGILISIFGVLKIQRWGLYLFAFSVFAPLFYFFFRYSDDLISSVGIFGLMILFYTIIIYKAHELKHSGYLEWSKTYIKYAIAFILILILISIMSITSCADYITANVQNISNILRIDDILAWIGGVFN